MFRPSFFRHYSTFNRVFLVYKCSLIIDGPDGSLLFQSLKLHIQNKFSEPADGRASFLSQCAPPATPKERHSSVA